MHEITTPKSEFVNDKLIFQNINTSMHIKPAGRGWTVVCGCIYILDIAAAGVII
jgi:hypothetical protein